MHSRVSLPYRHGAVIARSDPPPDCRRRFTASSQCGDRAFRWLLLEYGMLFRRLLILRHRCCSSAATSRRHCMFQSSYSSPYCPAVWQTVTSNTVRCPCNGLVREVSPYTPHWYWHWHCSWTMAITLTHLLSFYRMTRPDPTRRDTTV